MYNFVPTTESIWSASLGDVPVTATPLTMACWFIADDLNPNQPFFALCDYDTINIFNLEIDTANGSLFAGAYDAGWERSKTPNSSVAADTLYHAAGVFASSTSRTAYLDGVAATTSTASKTPTGIDLVTIGSQYYNSSIRDAFNGKVGHAAIWDAALTAAEVAALAAGASPLMIRPGNLVFYVPLINEHKFDVLGDTALTESGTPDADPNRAPVFHTRRQKIIIPPAAAAPAPAAAAITGRHRRHMLGARY